MPQGLLILLTEEWQSITCCNLQTAMKGLRVCLGTLTQACLNIGMFPSVYVTARARLASWGALADSRQGPTVADVYFGGFMDCLICFSPPHGIELLQRDDWQRRGRRREVCFQLFLVACCAVAIPLLVPTQLFFWQRRREIMDWVWPSPCCLNA